MISLYFQGLSRSSRQDELAKMRREMRKRLIEIDKHVEAHRNDNNGVGFEELRKGQDKLVDLLEDVDDEMAKVAKGGFR